eukprot:scaffold143912_cov31-Cyclotella_meneghiniana.AAC.1
MWIRVNFPMLKMKSAYHTELNLFGSSPSVGTSTPFSSPFLGGPLAFGVLCSGRDCSGPRRPIHLALQPWPSTINFLTESSRPMSISGQQPSHSYRRGSTFGRSVS